MTRDEALKLGLPRYFTGKACRAGHIAERRTSDYECCECVRLQKQRWNKKNKDYKAAKQRERKVRGKYQISNQDKERIKDFYWEAWAKSITTGIPHQVDHIIPLVNKRVCGLHVPQNLRVVTAEQNRKKGNRFDESLC